MVKIKDVLFIGAMDLPNLPKAGDTVKNQYLLEYLKSYRTVDYVDTYCWRKRPLLLFRIIWKVLIGRYKAIVYSVSNVSAYKLTKVFTSMPIQSRLIYFMIGGYTPIKIASGEYSAAPFKKLDKIIVEADKVVDLYKNVRLTNTLRVYNFKPYTFVPEINHCHTGIVKFVFLSRITEMKGAFLTLNAVKKLNTLGLEADFCVDFYGTIDQEIEERFLYEISTLQNAYYKGFLNLKDESNYTILSDYDSMLFPTMHLTEGFPGVIADAAIAGVPVIAAEWNYSEELLVEPKCGYVVQKGNVNSLADMMMYVINNRSENDSLRANCIKQAEKYKMSNVLTEQLLTRIGI